MKAVVKGLLFGLAFATGSVSAQGLPTVLSVGDGDTVTIEQDGQRIKVRLACIDAPETAQRPWGQQSRDRLRQLLPVGQPVQVRPVEKDRYGRTVAELYTNNQSVNLQMVKEGQAVVYRKYLAACLSRQQQYLQAESTARSQKLGFWNQSSAVLPWDFRTGGRTRTVPSPVTTTAQTTEKIAAIPIRQPVTGSCECPYDLTAKGRVCGGRSAYSHPGGRRPACYVGD